MFWGLLSSTAIPVDAKQDTKGKLLMKARNGNPQLTACNLLPSGGSGRRRPLDIAAPGLQGPILPLDRAPRSSQHPRRSKARAKLVHAIMLWARSRRARCSSEARRTQPNLESEHLTAMQVTVAAQAAQLAARPVRPARAQRRLARVYAQEGKATQAGERLGAAGRRAGPRGGRWAPAGW